MATKSHEPTPISWTGKSIVSLSLHRPASLQTRFDTLPFLALYTVWLTISISQNISQFFTTVGITVCIILHILCFLMQHWSVRLRALISWVRVDTLDGARVVQDKIHALCQPCEHRGKTELLPLKVDDQKRVYFVFQKRTFEYNAEISTFEKVLYPSKLKLHDYAAAARSSHGLSEQEIGSALTRFGTNKLELPAPTFAELYKENLLAPFFVFQVFCVFLWLLDEHWRYSLMTLVMMLMFEATVVTGRLRSLKELRGMRNPSLRVYVYRSKKWVAITSLELLPGDIVSIARGKDASHVVPCDLLILSGNAIVNESMLTGESVPLMKEGISSLQSEEMHTELSIKSTHKNHVLFGGTRVLTNTTPTISEATPSIRPPDGGCICYVLRTGFGSSQGELMRTILYSTESVTANSSEAALFILFLLVFALLASGYVLYHRYTDEPSARYKLLLRCILIITSVVPPELPMQLALAVNTSLIALVRNMVFCTEPYRIPFAGKIDICCFDKTGTITTDSINAAGVALPPQKQTEEVDTTAVTYKMVPVVEGSVDASLILSSCHSLVYVDNELIGDPLELAALEAADWMYGRSETCVPKRGGASSVSGKIVRRFRFASALQRMSVITVVGGGTTRTGPRVCVKGSPEAIESLLKDDEVPTMYRETARRLARGGMRVLALAQKNLDSGLTPSELMKMSREDVESQLSFVGFVCFECALRSDSRKVIRSLKKANHKVMMITGDATLTAAHVATQVGMCTKAMLVLEHSQVNEGSLEWYSANSGKRKKRFIADGLKDLSKDFDLCIGGSALQAALERHSEMKEGLQYVTVFARMSPELKERVMVSLKECGNVTLMCGDGTNDVGALKQAHVGVALLSAPPAPKKGGPSDRQAVVTDGDMASAGGSAVSKSRAGLRQRKKGRGGGVDSGSKGEKSQSDVYLKKMEELQEGLGESEDSPPLVKLGDASMASPFTSRRMTIDCCISIIRQGRCTLATTLQMYQILALNCLIQAYALSVLYLQGVVLGDSQMMIIGLVLAMAAFMVARAKPLERLSAERPAVSVFAPGMFLSLMSQFAIHVIALIACTNFVEPYIPDSYVPDIEAEFEPSLLNTVVFLLSISQQISVYLVNYKGRPFMQGIFDNRPLLYSLSAAFLILVVCALELSTELNEAMDLVAWPTWDLQKKICSVLVFDLFGSLMIDRTIMFVGKLF